MRATYKSEKAIGGNTNVDPKSGCKKIKNIGKAKQAATLRIPRKESCMSPTLDRANKLAPNIMVDHLAISDGCTLNNPKSIHLRAP